jgi:hypothetical protein
MLGVSTSPPLETALTACAEVKSTRATARRTGDRDDNSGGDGSTRTDKKPALFNRVSR